MLDYVIKYFHISKPGIAIRVPLHGGVLWLEMRRLCLRKGRSRSMHTDMNMTMSMHMRMGTNTNMVIALGTTIDLDLNPYENDGGYDCGHSCLSCYA